MRMWFALIISLTLTASGADLPRVEATNGSRTVFILPIRDDIEPPLLYLVRRGVKEAMEAKADLLVLDMKTDGGRVNTTDEIIKTINKFPGETVTYVNDRAFSAGAFISVATRKIYMAPQSVIGAAAPIVLTPTGDGVQKLPDSYEAKMVSAVSALVRTAAEKNGHDIEVIEAMIDRTRELQRVEYVRQTNGSVTAVTNVLNEKGRLLTLTDKQAAKEYGDPPKPLLSLGTVESMDALLKKLGYAEGERHEIKPTGAEQLGALLTTISPLLLIIGVIGIYIELKTPGFGIPGIIGITAFLLYFLGGYVAGLSGLEWVVVFLLGMALVAVELFIYPGTIALGLVGAALMLAAVIMAMVDLYPARTPALPGLPAMPELVDFNRSLGILGVTTIGSVIVILVLSRFLPKTPLYRAMVSRSASGVRTEAAQQERRASLQGQVGVTTCPLRPGGQAQFGDQVLDVISQGDMVPKGARVRVVGYSGTQVIVEVI